MFVFTIPLHLARENWEGARSGPYKIDRHVTHHFIITTGHYLLLYPFFCYGGFLPLFFYFGSFFVFICGLIQTE